jgi:hypothetical protein
VDEVEEKVAQNFLRMNIRVNTEAHPELFSELSKIDYGPAKSDRLLVLATIGLMSMRTVFHGVTTSMPYMQTEIRPPEKGKAAGEDGSKDDRTPGEPVIDLDAANGVEIG